jgi:hypothetical protein
MSTENVSFARAVFARVASNPAEFLSPGTTLYQKQYSVLKELHDELKTKFEASNLPWPACGEDISQKINIMQRDIEREKKGFMSIRADADSLLSSLAYVEKYFWYLPNKYES